jgi:hypothetical protein
MRLVKKGVKKEGERSGESPQQTLNTGPVPTFSDDSAAQDEADSRTKMHNTAFI